MHTANDLTPDPDTVLYDLVPELRKWVGWFRPATADDSAHLYHACRYHEVWQAHVSPDYSWMGLHPWAPHWVKEVLLRVRAEPLDIYEGAIVVELLKLLDLALTPEQRSQSLSDYVASGTGFFDKARKKKKWLCSSDRREQYLWQVIGEHTGDQPMQDLPEALAAAMARERSEIAKRMLEALRSDEGVFPAWLQSDFEGIADYTGLAEDMLGKASRLLWDLDHSGYSELVRTYKEARLFRLPPEVRERSMVDKDDREVPANLERTLARAALTVDLLG